MIRAGIFDVGGVLHKNTLFAPGDFILAHALFLTQMGLYDEFDELIFSYKVNLRKPDPRIYQLALDKLGVKAQDAFYVDDLMENVEAAKGLGMHGILFTSANELKEALKKLGVTV